MHKQSSVLRRSVKSSRRTVRSRAALTSSATVGARERQRVYERKFSVSFGFRVRGCGRGVGGLRAMAWARA